MSGANGSAGSAASRRSDLAGGELGIGPGDARVWVLVREKMAEEAPAAVAVTV
jgi:hypothetical protein